MASEQTAANNGQLERNREGLNQLIVKLCHLVSYSPKSSWGYSKTKCLWKPYFANLGLIEADWGQSNCFGYIILNLSLSGLIWMA